MISPVNRVSPVPYFSKKEEWKKSKEKSKDQSSSKKKKENPKKQAVSLPPSHSPSVSYDGHLEGTTDYEKAMKQYCYSEGKTSSFEVKI